MIQVVKPGLLTTVQDQGRPGYAHLGVPRSGALDRPALRRANRLVGNAAGAAGLETTLTGCTLRTTYPVVLAVTGAPADIVVEGSPMPFGVPLTLPAGMTVRIGPAQAGVRSYLAFAGGIWLPPVLGSLSTDTLSGLGPAPLRAGDTLPLGPPTTSASTVDEATAVGWQDIKLRVRLGPRDDWFTRAAIDELLGSAYTMSPKSNRVGARLTGAPLARSRPGELPSEGLVLGAVQVPADGQPLVFLADHPTTGGYPVIAVVDAADVALIAQARPGATVQFREA